MTAICAAVFAVTCAVVCYAVCIIAGRADRAQQAALDERDGR